ncbi:MAG: hypothetical protein IT176_00520 [Acidobacteria bacterium]|nr:hypothetical protein [Acidobacteriota bacterium]
MSDVRIADLEARLGEHLRSVRNGTLTVLDRDTPVARIIPFASQPLEIRKAKRHLRDLKLPRRPPSGPTASHSSLTTAGAFAGPAHALPAQTGRHRANGALIATAAAGNGRQRGADQKQRQPDEHHGVRGADAIEGAANRVRQPPSDHQPERDPRPGQRRAIAQQLNHDGG